MSGKNLSTRPSEPENQTEVNPTRVHDGRDRTDGFTRKCTGDVTRVLERKKQKPEGMEARELIGSEHVVTFVASRDQKPMVRIQGFVGFPGRDWRGRKPTIGQKMTVEVVGTNAKGNTLFVNRQDPHRDGDWDLEPPEDRIIDEEGNDVTFG